MSRWRSGYTPSTSPSFSATSRWPNTGSPTKPTSAGCLRRLEGERLTAWLDQAVASGFDGLKRFAGKLRVDRDAVQTDLTLRWSKGQTEGQVTKLKLVKRQGHGRAKVDLLRKRTLRAA